MAYSISPITNSALLSVSSLPSKYGIGCFDKAAYDADKKAQAEAIAKAKEDAKSEKAEAKAEKKAEKEAKAEAKLTESYDKYTEATITKSEEKADMLSAYEQAKADEKQIKEAEKSAKEAAKAAAAATATVAAVAEFADFTETFDREAYDAEKAAEAAAVAQAKAEVEAAKAEKRAEKAEKKEAKLVSAYEKETGTVIIERFNELSINPDDVPGVVVYSHGPFTWGKNASKAVENAIVLEEVSMMAWHTKAANPDAWMQQELSDKHYFRKHGANAYYGQKK